MPPPTASRLRLGGSKELPRAIQYIGSVDRQETSDRSLLDVVQASTKPPEISGRLAMQTTWRRHCVPHEAAELYGRRITTGSFPHSAAVRALLEPSQAHQWK